MTDAPVRKYKRRKREIVKQIYGLPYAREHVIIALMEWYRGSPRNPKNRRTSRKRSNMTQQTFTLELRMDCEDNGKYESMKQRMMILGRQAMAHAALLSQGMDIQPQLAMFTDDFYGKHEVISMLDDAVAKGLEEIGGEEETAIDPELAQALRSSQ